MRDAEARECALEHYAIEWSLVRVRTTPASITVQALNLVDLRKSVRSQQHTGTCQPHLW